MQLGLRVTSRWGAYSFLISTSQSQPLDSGVFVDLSSKGHTLLHFRRTIPLGALGLGRLLHEEEIIKRIFGKGTPDSFDKGVIESIMDELRKRESGEI